MKNEEALGKEFGRFYVDRLRRIFTKLPKRLCLEFSSEKISEYPEIALGTRSLWKDSRLTASDNSPNDRKWRFTGADVPPETVGLFEMILQELEKRFSDLLYLEAAEERISQYGEGIGGKGRSFQWDKAHRDKLIVVLVGDLLERKKLVEKYVTVSLEKKKLPPLELLIQLSAQKYEQRPVKTRMYFYKSDFSFSKADIQFEEPGEDVNYQDRKMSSDNPNLRTVRKMMEMAGENQGLLVRIDKEGYYIEGLACERAGMPGDCIEFTGHLSWAVKETEWKINKLHTHTLFEYREGSFMIPALDEDKRNDAWRKKLSALPDIFPALKAKENALGKIEKIIEELKRQRHGTSIVFMEKDLLEAEKKRLAKYKREYMVKPFPILKNTRKILGISAIDGAILADIEGRCHGVGAIVDGEVIVEGDVGRGARYNSLENYVNWLYKRESEEKKNTWCFAVILSEDEMVSLAVPRELLREIK